MSSQQLLLGSGGAKKKYIDDVFSTGGHYTTYTGTQTHPTGMDLTSEDGLTIFHRYIGGGVGNTIAFLDTFNRSDNKYWSLGQTAQMQENASSNYWNGFNSSGVSIGQYWSSYQSSSSNWPQNLTYNHSYKKTKGFFDLVEWTANGSNGTYNHDLGTQPGFIMIKKLTGSTNQGRTFGYHRAMRQNGKGWVQGIGNTNGYNYVNANSSTFSVEQVSNSYVTAQENGAKYVAYLWADYDSADWGETGDQSIVKCGTFTGNGSTSPGQIVDVGWDPHIIHFWGQNGSMNLTLSQDLGIAMQGGEWLNDESDARYIDWNQQGGGYTSMNANTGNWGGVDNPFCIIPGKGFQVRGNDQNINKSGNKYYYVAIRAGSQKPAENINEFFDCKKWTGNNQVNKRISLTFDPDMFWLFERNGSDAEFSDKVGQQRRVTTGSNTKSVNGREDNSTNAVNLIKNGFYAPAYFLPKKLHFPTQHVWNANSNYYTSTAWKRKYGVMAQVNYYGTGGTTQTLNHDLGVKPAAIIVMQTYNGTGYNSINMWCDSTYVPDMGDGKLLTLTSDANVQTRNDFFGDGSGGYVATDSVFRVAQHSNGSGDRMFSAYLFANIPGKVKFGQYTGNGTSEGDSQQINAGFSNGIKWIIIHKMSGGNAGTERGGFMMADTTRGINNGSNSYDPVLPTWGGGQQFWGALNYGEAKASQNSAFTNSGNWMENDLIDNNYSAGFVVKRASSYNYNGQSQLEYFNLNQNGYKYWYWAVAA